MSESTAITNYSLEVPLAYSQNVIRKTIQFHDEERRMPTHIMGGMGSGKSLLAGRLVFHDFIRGRPQVVIDPTGGTIDAFLNEMIWLPGEWQCALWNRVRYTSLSATDYVDPSPIFTDLYGGSLMAQIQKQIDLIVMSDPALDDAPIQGTNSLSIYADAGRVGLALGGQLPEIVDIVKNPKKWKSRFGEARINNPEIEDAVSNMSAFAAMAPGQRARETGTFLTKTAPYLATPELNARYCTTRQGLTMPEVAAQSITWLIDGRGVSSRLKAQLLLRYLLEVTFYANHVGYRGRKTPISVVIDEITELLGFSSSQNEVMASLIEQLISVLSRNYGIYTTMIHQSLQQISSERIRAALMSMPNQFIGQIHDPNDRLYLAHHFFKYDPYKVKKKIPQYVNKPFPVEMMVGGRPTLWSEAYYEVQQYLTEEFTIDEQLLMYADRFKPGNLDSLQFLLRRASHEGDVNPYFEKMDLLPYEGRFPDELVLADTRQQLKERDGYPVTQLHVENIVRVKDAVSLSNAALKDKSNATLTTTKDSELPNETKKRRRVRKKKTRPTSSTEQTGTSWEEEFYEGTEGAHDE